MLLSDADSRPKIPDGCEVPSGDRASSWANGDVEVSDEGIEAAFPSAGTSLLRVLPSFRYFDLREHRRALISVLLEKNMQ
jgi:hypothetical protein